MSRAMPWPSTNLAFQPDLLPAGESGSDDALVRTLLGTLEPTDERIALLDARIAELRRELAGKARGRTPPPIAADRETGRVVPLFAGAETEGAWAVNHEVERFIEDLTRSYEAGQTAPSPTRPEAFLAPAALVNEDVHLEGAEHPIPLALIAALDPLKPTALGAAARLASRLSDLPVGVSIAELLAEVSRHQAVRQGVKLVLNDAFSPAALRGLRGAVHHALEQDRERARIELIEYLGDLAKDNTIPHRLVDDLLSFNHRMLLNHHLLKKLVIGLVDSRKVDPAVKVILIRDMHRLSGDLRLEIMTRIGLLDDSATNRPIKRALEQLLASPRGRAYLADEYSETRKLIC